MTARTDAAQAAAQLRGELALIERWQLRANFEYVSKGELREIARGACAGLQRLLSAAVQRAEDAAASSEPSIIVPLGAGDPQGSIVRL